MKPPWVSPPTANAKNSVQRSVRAILDQLAPERVVSRTDRLPGRIEQHRSPTGCVLQAATEAVSVSWLAGGGNDASLGELHIIVWRGTVSPRGATQARKGATIVAELGLRPIEPVGTDCVWQTVDGDQYDSGTLAAKCMALLEEQIRAGS